jgi:hypothetical protein
MSTNKADENMSYRELHDYHETVFVAPDIKDIVLVANIIGGRKIHLDV